jgi:hypothetical protein
MYYQYLFFLYLAKKPYADSRQMLEYCNICGHKEKAGYNYCRFRAYRRELFPFFLRVISVIIFIWMALFPSHFKIPLTFGSTSYLLFFCLLYLVYYFSNIYLEKLIKYWNEKIVEQERTILRKTPKQKL